MEIGASFSHRHLSELGISPDEAIKEFKNLHLTWIRLGCYWDEIEEIPGKFNFSKLDSLVKFCGENRINVLLTVGMKAPRYPEYYIPNWLLAKTRKIRLSTISPSDKLLKQKVKVFLGKVIKHFKKSKAIKIWQAENEPLDVSGSNWWKIDKNFLKEEVNLVRKLDPTRKVLINLWGNELTKRKLYQDVLGLADIVGLDIYLRHPIPIKIISWLNLNRYVGPMDSVKQVKEVVKKIKDLNKDVWIAELQMEPWEPSELVAKSDHPKSFLPEHFKTNFEYALNIGASTILLWGFEYWLWRKSVGDLRYWNEAKKLLRQYK